MPRITTSSTAISHAQCSSPQVLQPIGQSDSKRSKAPTRTSSTSSIKADPARIKRPPNCFILFRTQMCQIMSLEDPEWHTLSQPQKSFFISHLWNNAAPELKLEFAERAKVIADEHKRAHPEYRFTPMKREDKEDANAGKGRGNGKRMSEEERMLLQKSTGLIKEAKQLIKRGDSDAETKYASTTGTGTAASTSNTPNTSYDLSSQFRVDPGLYYQPSTEEDPYGLLSHQTSYHSANSGWNGGMSFEAPSYAGHSAYPSTSSYSSLSSYATHSTYPSFIPPSAGMHFTPAPVNSHISNSLDISDTRAHHPAVNHYRNAHY